MGAGACARGWTVSYRLAEVLTLAAAPRDRALAAARGVRSVHRRRQRPRTGLHGPARCAADQDAADYASAPAMVRNWYQDALDTLA
jgi:hypothetical protein